MMSRPIPLPDVIAVRAFSRELFKVLRMFAGLSIPSQNRLEQGSNKSRKRCASAVIQNQRLPLESAIAADLRAFVRLAV